jgi:ferritin
MWGEKVGSPGSVLEQLKLLQGNKNGLFMVDRELAKRTNPSGFVAETVS